MKYIQIRSFLLFMVVLASPASAIVGGVAAVPGDASGQVALIDVSRPQDDSCDAGEVFCKQFCSGVLVAPEWVLTAAHCVDSALTVNLRVLADTTDLYSADLEQTVGVTAKYVHPSYGISATFDSDVALLKLDQALSGVARASLIEESAFSGLMAVADSRNDEVRASGWGRLSGTGGFPKALRRVDLDLLQDAVCEGRYNQLSVVRYISSHMLCVSEPTPSDVEIDDAGDLSPEDTDGEGVCNYDSGGPLTSIVNGSRQVVGLTSFSPQGNCAGTDLPSVFTRVLAYVPWIEETARLAGTNFGDLALSLDGDFHVAPGAAAPVIIRLGNNSQLPVGSAVSPVAISGAGFDVVVSGGVASLANIPFGLICTEIASGWRCSASSPLMPGSYGEVRLNVTPLDGGNQFADVTVTSFSSEGDAGVLQDYRSSNNGKSQRILYSSLPDVELVMDGYSAELLGAGSSMGARVWLLGKVRNNNAAVAASNVEIGLSLPDGYVLEAWELDLDECAAASQVCVISGLAPGEEKLVRVRLWSPGAKEGVAGISVSLEGGDFPQVRLDGGADTDESLSITFNWTVEEVDRADSGGVVEAPKVHRSSGGVVEVWLLMVLAFLGLWRSVGGKGLRLSRQ